MHDPLPEHVARERVGSGLDLVGGACVEMTSTSFMTVAGLKKCMPTTFSGRLVTIATSMIGYDDVLVAMIARQDRGCCRARRRSPS